MTRRPERESKVGGQRQKDCPGDLGRGKALGGKEGKADLISKPVPCRRRSSVFTGREGEKVKFFYRFKGELASG